MPRARALSAYSRASPSAAASLTRRAPPVQAPPRPRNATGRFAPRPRPAGSDVMSWHSWSSMAAAPPTAIEAVDGGDTALSLAQNYCGASPVVTIHLPLDSTQTASPQSLAARVRNDSYMGI